jgi:hypothetical protein
MSNFLERLKEISKPVSSVKHKKDIIRTITRVDVDRINQVIDSKIKQNKQ